MIQISLLNTIPLFTFHKNNKKENGDEVLSNEAYFVENALILSISFLK